MTVDADTAEFEVGRRKATSVAGERVEADVYGVSHPGRVRVKNEDHYLIARFGRFFETVQSNLPPQDVVALAEEKGCGAIVADGVGGNAAGEEASRMAITFFIDLVLNTPDWILRTEQEQYALEVDRRAAERFQQVSAMLADQAAQNPRLRGFATTMTMVAHRRRKLVVAHIGDSRAYLFRRGKLNRLTHDHTLAQTLADQGLIDAEDVSHHWLRHALNRALGGESVSVQTDIKRLNLEDADIVLVCTDGLTEMVDEGKIAETLAAGGTAQNMVAKLIADALQNGGKDNVTAVVLRFQVGK